MSTRKSTGSATRPGPAHRSPASPTGSGTGGPTPRSGSAGRSTALALLLAIIAPADSSPSFMSPYTDWTSLLFNPIGTFVLLAIGLNIVVG